MYFYISTKPLFFLLFPTSLSCFLYFFVPHFCPVLHTHTSTMWIFLLVWSSDLEHAEGRWTLVSGSFIFELISCLLHILFLSQLILRVSDFIKCECLKEKHNCKYLFFTYFPCLLGFFLVWFRFGKDCSRTQIISLRWRVKCRTMAFSNSMGATYE